MPATIRTVRTEYPLGPQEVEAGQLGRAIAERGRALENYGAVHREYRGWEGRLRTVEALISAAVPSSDMHELAAALAERDVLKRALEQRLPAVRSAEQTMRNASNAAELLANEYLMAISTVENIEERGQGYREDAERARRRLVELAGPPAE